MKPNTKKTINYILLALQLLLLAVALDLGGWWLIIYLTLNLIWAVYWSYNNWWILKSVSETLLHMGLGKEYLKYKVEESKKKNTKQYRKQP